VAEGGLWFNVRFRPVAVISSPPYPLTVKFVRKLLAKLALVTAAVILGAFVVIADVVLFGALLDRKPDFSEPLVLIVRGLLVAAPFLCLAYRGSTRLLPWLTGIALTLWLWWRFLQDGVAYQRAPDGSGVDMAFALLMLVSPAFIGVLCVWIDVVMRNRLRRS
jgi:hypothetical protein